MFRRLDVWPLLFRYLRSRSNLDRGLRHLKRSEIPRPPLIRSRHFAARGAKLPASILPKSRVGFVQDDRDVFPFCGTKKHVRLERWVQDVVDVVGENHLR